MKGEEVIKVEDCGSNIGDYDIPIHNAIIIPRGATNGDMIKALFSDGRVIEREDGDIEYDIYVKGTFSFCILFDELWWDAPYKAESEG
jgi:hypothetical protein